MDRLILDPEYELPDHIEIHQDYFPQGIGPGGMSPSTMRLHALAYQRGYIHEYPMKSWVLLWLMDHIDWDKALIESEEYKNEVLKARTSDSGN